MIYKSKHFIHQLISFSLIFLHQTHSATLSDVLTLNTDPSATSRVARDNKYYSNRQQQQQQQHNQHHQQQQPIDNQRDATTSTRLLKPEESPEARDYHQETSAIGKRCSRCGDDGRPDYYRTTSFNYPRKDYYSRYPDPYETSRSRYDDRYDIYDRNYDRNYDPNDYYDYYDRDGYRRPSTSSYSGYSSGYSSGRDLYDRDRYEPRDTRYYSRDNRNQDRFYDRAYDKSYDRAYDRGIGYDNIGYDYRGYDRNSYDYRGYDRNNYDRSGGYDRYRPYDETYRGTSGFDSSGRGYYYNRPDGGRFGTYASSWGYGRDDRDRVYRDPGSYRNVYRPRDYHSYGTSYLYDRPSSSTTTSPPNNQSDRDNSVTDSPHDTSSTG